MLFKNKVTPTQSDSLAANYSVGQSTDGRTTLTITSDGYSVVLSLDDTACRRLIRLLAATLDEDQL